MTASAKSQPFVSVVSPFHNTAPYLAECIESVLRQSYENFEYILVDNQSTDQSRAIVEGYVAKDPRVRLLSTDRFLTQMQNYNFALRQISPEARYCKMVQADDWIAPSCVSEMVAAAESFPSAGLISAYRIEGNAVRGTGLDARQSRLAGRDAARLHFMGPPIFLFGTQTTVMYRADLIREASEFFDESLFHADTDAAYRILRHHDFVFIHQVLTYSRVDADSISGQASDLCPHDVDFLAALIRHGSAFLDPGEYGKRLEEAKRTYYRGLALKWVRDPPLRYRARFQQYHRDMLASVGERFDSKRFATCVMRQLAVECLPSAFRRASLHALHRPL